MIPSNFYIARTVGVAVCWSCAYVTSMWWLWCYIGPNIFDCDFIVIVIVNLILWGDFERFLGRLWTVFGVTLSPYLDTFLKGFGWFQIIYIITGSKLFKQIYMPYKIGYMSYLKYSSFGPKLGPKFGPWGKKGKN